MRHSERFPDDFLTLEDGYWYFWPAETNQGAYSAYNLREIADELDAMNKPWDDSVNEFFQSSSTPEESIHEVPCS